MRLIDADELKRLRYSIDEDTEVVEVADIDNAPHLEVNISNMQDLIEAMKAEPIKHGRWIDDGDSILHCTCCHRYIRRIVPVGYTYCPHCGAKMDGERKKGKKNET